MAKCPAWMGDTLRRRQSAGIAKSLGNCSRLFVNQHRNDIFSGVGNGGTERKCHDQRDDSDSAAE